ncbi:UDP-N-acetylglucosamine 2-epimerase [hydrothermal vent metagenome]|uniref:UDP-N-acetylglucosamine 2-epimerase (non-hydrolyzing) n=1 Tax=hydrothermal vent metagenome TaxID=652676 RepID=A0A1W1BNG9_9ZZZZ
MGVVKKQRVLIIFGTRPEAIKMAPIISELYKKREIFELRVCVTAQHREMLDHVVEFFDISVDYDLDIMRTKQDLYDITTRALLGLRDVLDDFLPDVILVHGDTTTTFVASLAGFYHKIKIAHIEAGLRTYNLYNPWPEEANRQLTGVLAHFHFVPTKEAKQNLLQEGKEEKNIVVTGNTVIDALFLTLEKIGQDKNFQKRVAKKLQSLTKSSRFILVTGHRRENFGKGFLEICQALKMVAQKNPSIDIIYPVHLNPNVQKPVYELLKGIKNIHLIKPLKYEEFVYMMSKCYFVITDSGGIQEEAPSLGKPVLVMREVTERMEAIEAGTVKLVGTNTQQIFKEAQRLIDDKEEYARMSQAHNPYGDGMASKRVVEFLVEALFV